MSAKADTVPRWVVEAARWPVAFAQVREDPLLDAWVVGQIGPGAQVAQIASGGCTAAYLAACSGAAALHLVDPNPAQLALARLKLGLLRYPPGERMRLLGHAPMDAAERRLRLAGELALLGLDEDALGPPDFVTAAGPDHAGRYERTFAALREELAPVHADLEVLLLHGDASARSAAVAPHTSLGRCIDAAFDSALALDNLACLFGSEATSNPVEPFSRHFARQFRNALATMPAADNPFLWQMLTGRFSPHGTYPWLTCPPPSHTPAVTWTCGSMAEVLRESPARYDFVHLSNILDWLTPGQATATLEVASAALRPGGWTLIRQLNSTLDIPALGPMFDWQTDTAAGLHARDRSFFYRSLHLGRRR